MPPWWVQLFGLAYSYSQHTSSVVQAYILEETDRSKASGLLFKTTGLSPEMPQLPTGGSSHGPTGQWAFWAHRGTTPRCINSSSGAICVRSQRTPLVNQGKVSKISGSPNGYPWYYLKGVPSLKPSNSSHSCRKWRFIASVYRDNRTNLFQQIQSSRWTPWQPWGWTVHWWE